MSNLALIQPQRVDFDTQQTCDWLDGLPVIGTPGPGGTAAGAANVGNGALAVASVGTGAALGAHLVSVTGIAGGFTRISVTGPDDTVSGRGVVGLQLYAGGITFTLAQGATPFAVGDTFAIAVRPVAIDLTGLRFDLDSRVAQGAQTYALQASTAEAAPTIVNGGPSGVIAMRVPRARLARCPVAPASGYPYSILATDPDTGLTVTAFYGLIHHTAVAAQLAS